MTTGFNGLPPPVAGLWASTYAEAWELYEINAATHGHPIKLHGRYLVPRAWASLNEPGAIQATLRYMVTHQQPQPDHWKGVKGALLPEGQAWGWYMAHKDECSGPPSPYDSTYWLVPTKDGKPREVRPISLTPTVTPHKGSAAAAAKLRPEDRKRISNQVSRSGRRRDAHEDHDEEGPEQVRFLD